MDALRFPLTWWFGLAGFLSGLLVSVLVFILASQRERRAAKAAREQQEKSLEELRAANAKLQSKLNKERTAAAQGKNAGSADDRALVLHLQSQLRAANMELDRMQRNSPVIASKKSNESEDPDGFAMTRPHLR